MGKIVLSVIVSSLILGGFGFAQEAWGFAYVFSGGDETISPGPAVIVGNEIIADDLEATLIGEALSPYLADRVTHPIGYSGAPGVLTVTIGIDPTSVFAAQMVQPLQNNIAVFNGLVPTSPNLFSGGANNIPAGFADWESVNLHEMGHAIGLAHVNAASESGLVGTDRDYTKATNGVNNVFDLNPGVDAIKGSAADVRGDDNNLNWYRTSNNNPMTIAGTVDSTNYARVLASLPAGDLFAANADRTVTAALGFPNSEAVMQQGTFTDEAQRNFVHDDAAGIRYAAAGIDEIAGTGDDYTLNLVFAGLTTVADIVITFDNTLTPFASTFVSGTALSGDHIVILSALISYNTGLDWFFNPPPAFAGVIDFESGFIDQQAVGAVVTATNTVTFGVGSCTNPTTAFIAEAGTPTTAYAPTDNIPLAASGGLFFLTNQDAAPKTTLDYCISFATPVSNLSVDLYDYRTDGGGIVGGLATLSVFDSVPSLVGSVTFVITAGLPDPNLATLSIQSPSGLISSAVLSFDSADQGTGIDNITFTIDDPVAVPVSSTGGGGAHEPPTIGMNMAGSQQMVTRGMGIDGQFWTVTQFFHEEMKLIQMLSGSHTISNTIFCNEGVNECDYVGIAFTRGICKFNDPVMKVEAQKTDGEWIISWYDPQDFIQDPDDAIPGKITFSAQITGDFLITSFTINFKNKDTGELVIGVQVRDVELGVRTFWFNEGVEFIDSDAYPSIVTEFENTLEIDSLCLNENPDYRYSCAFAKKVQLEIERAEKLLKYTKQ